MESRMETLETLDCDSEPEEINLKASKEYANVVFQNERKAIQSSQYLNKWKRKLDNEKYIQQKAIKKKNTIEKLSQSLLNEINIDKSVANEEMKSIDSKSIDKKRKSKTKDKRIGLETDSTIFNVIDINNDLSKLASNLCNNQKKSGISFKDEMLYNNRRHKRMGTSVMRANFEKQYFNSK